MGRTLVRNEKAYKNMMAVAKMLEALSPNEATYTVEDTYLDYGQDWMWTTIICRKDNSSCQILSPRQWKMIEKAETLEYLVLCVEDIRNDKYFTDK